MRNGIIDTNKTAQTAREIEQLKIDKASLQRALGRKNSEPDDSRWMLQGIAVFFLCAVSFGLGLLAHSMLQDFYRSITERF